MHDLARGSHGSKRRVTIFQKLPCQSQCCFFNYFISWLEVRRQQVGVHDIFMHEISKIAT